MTTLQAAPAAVARPVRTGIVLTVLLTAQLMAILDVNIVNVAGATIRADLHTSGSGLQLVITGYTIAYAVLLITGARAGSLIGYRRAFLIGLVAFTAASLACALAANGGQLIAFRFVQGAAAALMIPQVFSLIQRYFTGATRARALGRYAAVIAGGVVLGQIVGGALVDANLWGTGWRPIFMINVPIGLAVLFFGQKLLPPEGPETPRPLDLPGLMLLAAAVLTLVVPLVLGHEEGWPAWCWASLITSALLFAAFALVQRRVTTPLMPGRLFAAPGMVAALAALILPMVAYGGYLFTVALHLQVAVGYSPLLAGLCFVPMAFGFALSSLNWRRLPARWHTPGLGVGLLIGAVSLVGIAYALHGTAPIGGLFLALQVPFGIGFGLSYAPAIAHGLAHVQPADAADASGLITTNLQLAQVLGVAVLGSVYLGQASPGPAVAAGVLIEAGLAALAGIAALILTRRRW